MPGIFKKALITFVLFFLGLAANAFAQDITLVLSGQTHAMVYHCNCPIEPDGGIARRATLVQQLRKTNPNILLLDSGSFFAGGTMDQSSRGEDLDKARTLVNLKAMSLMRYDAVLPGPEEFNFGLQFLEDNIAKSGIVMLAANMDPGKAAQYFVKTFGKTRVGVIGLAGPVPAAEPPVVFSVSPEEALKNAVARLKELKAGVIILMSGFDEAKNRELLQANPEVNIIIEGAKFAKEKVSSSYGKVLAVAPRWEGRRMVAVSFSIKGRDLQINKIEDLRVWDKLPGDKEVLSILPECFLDNDCRKEGSIASCQDPGTQAASCRYTVAPKVGLTVINKADCRTCDTGPVVNSLKREFPGLSVSYLNFPGDKAGKLIEELDIRALPVYLLDKGAENGRSFEILKERLEPRGGYYMLKAQAAGFGFFLHRPEVAGRLDVFMDLFSKDSGDLLDTLKEFSPEVHFLAVEDGGEFSSPGGKLQTEEYLRSVCVKKYYPGIFYNYITCRSRNFDSSWWDTCLADMDLSQVKTCALGQEGRDLLKENIELGRELSIGGGPTYLLDNEEIFSSFKVPQKEELRKILKR